MTTFWLSLKRSLQCKSEPSDFHNPRARSNLCNIQTSKSCRSGCSRSISNLRDVIHGSKRHAEEKPPCCSPRSLGSTDLLHPLAHEVILSDSTCELRITGFGGNVGGKSGSTFVGTLKPGTPCPEGDDRVPRYNSKMLRLSRKMHGDSPLYGGGNDDISTLKPRGSLDADIYASSTLICRKCGEKLKKLDAVEAHHLAEHAVTELVEGDSSRRIVEIICKAAWLKSENNCVHIERVLKVHNMQITLAQFEEQREIVKNKASKLSTKHPRCLADGNELLRFFGTTVICSLGMNGSSSLCISDKCNVCQILRHGFKDKELDSGVGIFTTSTSGRALESIEVNADSQLARKALLVCRVIAGRVHRPLENFKEMAGQSGFDSLAGKVSQLSMIEELYVLNSKALLPCFVVICKP